MKSNKTDNGGNTLRIKFMGATDGVTGSCTLLEHSTKSGTELYLVDIGDYQDEFINKNKISEIMGLPNSYVPFSSHMRIMTMLVYCLN
jgi:VIT1/CCC1 family predicted Fe2+/Mn2+ transporter